MFIEFLKLGIEHILDVKAYDHLLFLALLCLGFVYSGYKKLIYIATAFTIGHSISLALSVFGVVNINQDVIELLIPVTILITGIITWLSYRNKKKINFSRNYLPALGFGLIHGLGFSGYLRPLLQNNTDLWHYLLAFNMGVEIGQIIFILFFIFAAKAFIGIFGIRERSWINYGSGIGILLSILMIIQKVIVII